MPQQQSAYAHRPLRAADLITAGAGVSKLNLHFPKGRYAYIQAHGVEAFKKAMKDEGRDPFIETVNGHEILPTNTRFGLSLLVGDTGRGFPTLRQARDYAHGTEP
jgi:hypothetical protein